MKRSATFLVASIAALGLFLSLTTPNNLSSSLLIVPFVLLFVALLSLASFLCSYRGVPARQGLKVGAIVASVPVLLLVLQSIGQLTLKDVLTIFIFFAMAYFYVSRLASHPRKSP